MAHSRQATSLESMDRDRAAADRGGKDRKGVGGAALAEDGDVDDAEVKHLSLDFQTGQRILSRVHILCQVRTRRTGARASPRVECAATPPCADTPPPSPLGRPAALLHGRRRVACACRASGSRQRKRWTA